MFISKQLYSNHFSRGSIVVMRMIIGCLLIWGCATKIQFPYHFLELVAAYELLDSRSAIIVAGGVPFLELVVGLLLIAGVAVNAALLVSTLLFTIFFLAQALAIYRGLEISCGCFDAVGDVKVSYFTLLRVGVLLATAIVCYLFTVIPRPTTQVATAR